MVDGHPHNNMHGLVDKGGRQQRENRDMIICVYLKSKYKEKIIKPQMEKMPQYLPLIRPWRPLSLMFSLYYDVDIGEVIQLGVYSIGDRGP